MHFNPQIFKVSIIQTKLFGPLEFELSRFHCSIITCCTCCYYISTGTACQTTSRCSSGTCCPRCWSYSYYSSWRAGSHRLPYRCIGYHRSCCRTCNYLSCCCTGSYYNSWCTGTSSAPSCRSRAYRSCSCTSASSTHWCWSCDYRTRGCISAYNWRRCSYTLRTSRWYRVCYDSLRKCENHRKWENILVHSKNEPRFNRRRKGWA